MFLNLEPELEAMAHKVIGAAIEVHRTLGPGYQESLYERALSIELSLRGIDHACQAPIRVLYKGTEIGEGRMDMIVGDQMILELKAVESLANVHHAQVISYLKATHRKLGLLMNFNSVVLKDGIRRIIN